MPGSVASLVRQDPARVVVVTDRIPAVHADIGAAAERDLAVDHHDLLVVARPKWDVAILVISDGRILEPLTRPMLQDRVAAVDRNGRLPDQRAHVEGRVDLGQANEHLSDFVGVVWPLVTVRRKPSARVEGPSQDPDGWLARSNVSSRAAY